MKINILLIMLILSLFGCGKSEPPEGNFEKFVINYVNNLQEVYNEYYNNVSDNEKRNMNNMPTTILLNSCRYDVKKTDSLIQPYIGIIIIKTERHSKFLNDSSRKLFMEWSYKFFWQDGKWMPSTQTYLKDGSTSDIVYPEPSWKAYQKTEQ